MFDALAKPAPHDRPVRIEIETPAAILGEPDSVDVPSTYRTHYFDLAATGWEPTQKLAQVYISPKLMEGMLADLRNMNAHGDPEVKELIVNLSVTVDAITYAASGDDQSLMHELHLPKGLLQLFASSASVAIKQAPLLGSESRAMYLLTTIAEAEESYKSKGKSGYATLNVLRKEKLIPEGLLEGSNYKIDLTVSGDSFEATATPRQSRSAPRAAAQ